MESQGKQLPTKVKWWHRLRWQHLKWAIKKNKDDALEEFPLSKGYMGLVTRV